MAVKLNRNLLNVIYPIGSIYMSVNSTNPSNYFGGTWIAWGAGKVPVGFNSNENEFNSVEKTGGSKTHYHTQGTTGSTTLTINQIPSHTHDVGYYANGKQIQLNGGGSNYSLEWSTTGYGDTNSRYELKALGAGGGKGHTHTNPNTAAATTLQPYIVCYMWKRTG